LAGIHPVMALDSNGVRVLLRLGFGEERPGYAATLRSVRGAAGPELEGDFGPLVRAYLLLRTHGRGLCRRSSPACPACPLAERCACALAAG
jgi:endonuclease III